jgi:hypothetical protein
MSEAKHTPGSWWFRRIVGDLDFSHEIHAGETAVAAIYSESDISDADARLIAAAPDLLAAAQGLRAAQRAYMADRGNDSLGAAVGLAATEMDAAIAKATLA